MMSLVGCATCLGGCASSMQVPMPIARIRNKIRQMLEILMATMGGRETDIYYEPGVNLVQTASQGPG